MESVDKQVSLACSVSSLIDFDQNLFQQFMQKKSCMGFSWCFKGKVFAQEQSWEKTACFKLL